MTNPFFLPTGPEGVPPFDAIEPGHYREAFDRAFAEHDAEIELIVGNADAPDFANTLEAQERSGALLESVEMAFFNAISAASSEELEALDLEISPRFAVHNSRIDSNPALFARIEAVRDTAQALSSEQQRLLDETWRRAVRAGARLDGAQRARVDALNEELGGDDFEVITVSSGRNPRPAVDAFFKEANIKTLPKYADPTTKFSRSSGVLGLPVTLILDENGHEIARLQGEAEWNGENAKAILTEIIGG